MWAWISRPTKMRQCGFSSDNSCEEKPMNQSRNIRWQSLSVSKASRACLKSQKPRCIWLTGLSASGKSTLADLLERRLFAAGAHTYVLDGDNVRHGLNKDLGFSDNDRAENIRRVAEVAKLMVDAGLIVIVSFISPFRAERDFARSLFEPEEFFEVFVDAPLEACISRDPKGLYRKALSGQLSNFTGLDSLYEAPENPELVLKTAALDPGECIEALLLLLSADQSQTLADRIA